MSKELQKELFGEFKVKEPRFRQIARKMLPQRKMRILHVSLESVIFVAILIILCIVVAFALGVEKGKRSGHLPSSDVAEPVVALRQDKGIVPEEVIDNKVIPVVDNVLEPVAEYVPDEQVGDSSNIEKPYTIQLIAYKDKKKALDKVNEFKNKGYESSIIERQDWYQVCTGSYSGREEAKRDLQKFSAKYPGCFFRKKGE